MYCPRCGQTNPDQATSCARCSTSLGGALGRAAVPVVPSYLPTAILVTLCCCLPAGIPAIVLAAQSSSSLQQGDYLAALAKARQAYTWCWVSFGLGLLVVVLQLVVGLAG